MGAEYRFQHSKYPPPGTHIEAVVARSGRDSKRCFRRWAMELPPGSRWPLPEKKSDKTSRIEAKVLVEPCPYQSSQSSPTDLQTSKPRRAARPTTHDPQRAGSRVCMFIATYWFGLSGRTPDLPPLPELPGRAGKLGVDTRLPLSLWRNDFIVRLK